MRLRRIMRVMMQQLMLEAQPKQPMQLAPPHQTTSVSHMKPPSQVARAKQPNQTSQVVHTLMGRVACKFGVLGSEPPNH